ncbi:CHASE2 domain-containing protein [Bryobacter aggregatus]|uniref:CHASE2 domain-containing protein n=1 Tax=Bryobacter aggregatus TaxID=360054 RepID=UPI0004E196D7|nr:CHASE2 domain-containing protein [Bryobacter aggregatus]
MGYLGGLLSVCFAVALLFGWSQAASQLDGQAYDWLFSVNQPENWKPKAMLLAIDEGSLIEIGGARHLRQALADALDEVCAAKPLAIAVDLMLSTTEEPKSDQALERAFQKCPSVVLGTDIMRDGLQWEEPTAAFRKVAASLGHVHADPDPVSRRIPLEKAVAARRYWALALEAFRLSRQSGPILETPEDLEVGMTKVPAARPTARSVYIRYAPAPIPQVSLKELRKNPASALLFSGKVVFVGYTDQSSARDRLMTPMGHLMTGVEIHANLFETLQQGVFLEDAPVSFPVLLTLIAVVGAGLIFVFLSGSIAWVSAAAWLVLIHFVPQWLFWDNLFLRPTMPLTGVWLATIASASFHYFVIRRQWKKSEADKNRYQQAIHFVTHEMKTPLTAIQGSSEIMSRYKLNEDKQKQIAQMIHAESKRLASMIQTFLDVERLAEGEIELKREVFGLNDVLLAALDRARVLAEKKEMAMSVGAIPAGQLRGDKELLEYAIYNLLNNAVKYSPESTGIECNCVVESGKVKIAIRDHGMGMEPQDLKKIFDRFYRSKRAEESGISGTGIGLSIVNEIVQQHEGRIDVESELGVGSVFTVILPFRPSASVDSEVGNANQRTTIAR